MRRSGARALRSLLIAVTAITMVGCAQGQSTSSSSSNIAGGSITVRLPGDWTIFDPQITSGQPSSYLIQGLYDRLVTIGPGARVVPYLAKSWTQTPTSVTFQLRTPDATCADGSKLTPTAIANSFRRLVGGPLAGQLFGAGPFTVSADDGASTFTLTMGTPDTDALFGFARYQAGIVCPSGLANPASLQTAPAGSGPYTIASAVHGDAITLNARPDWAWGPNGTTSKSSGFPQTITYKVISDDTTAANLLLTHGLDLSVITGPDVQRLLQEKSLTHKVANSYTTYPLSYNETPGRPTAIKEVRQALSTAIDQRGWNQAAYQGRGLVSSSILAPNADCYDPATAKLIPAPDPAKAAQILEAAGYTMDSSGHLQKDGQPLVINFLATTVNFGSGPEYLVTQWEKAGITVNASITDFNTYLQNLLKGNFDVVPEQLPADSPNPTFYAASFTGAPPPSGANYGRANDPVLKTDLTAATAALGSARCPAWAKFQEDLLRNYDIWPMTAPNTQWFSRSLDFLPGVSNFQPQFVKRVA